MGRKRLGWIMAWWVIVRYFSGFHRRMFISVWQMRNCKSWKHLYFYKQMKKCCKTSDLPFAGSFSELTGRKECLTAFTAWLFMKDKERDLHVKGTYLHMAALGIKYYRDGTYRSYRIGWYVSYGGGQTPYKACVRGYRYSSCHSWVWMRRQHLW